MVEDERVSQEVSGSLVFQLPVAAQIRRRLDELEAERLPWVPPFAAMVDAVFRHLVAREATVARQGQPMAPAADAVEVLERLAVVCDVQAQLGELHSSASNRELVSPGLTHDSGRH
jgi:hypothetical protein